MKHATNRNRLTKLIDTSLFAALICVATMAIKIPTPTNGYLHLGDAVVLLSGFLLGPFHGALAAALGSMFADLFSGYFPYAPATFLIKGCVALAGYLAASIWKQITKRTGALPYLLGGIVGESIMILGYYLFEAIICGYGFLAASLGIPGNIVQGAGGAIIGALLTVTLQKTSVTARLLQKHELIGKD